MPRQKLTDTVAARAQLPEGKAEFLIADSDLVGFGLRVRSASKTWIVTYRPQGQGRTAAPKRLKLGSADVLKAAEARSLARAAIGSVARGQDPLAERQAQKIKSVSTVDHLLSRYDQDFERRGYVNRRTVISGLRSRLAPLLRNDIRNITGQQIADIIDEVRASGRAGAAEDFRSRCRAFFGWCVTEAKILPVNPLAGFRKQRATRADRIAKAQHGRALTDNDLVKVWQASDPATVFGRYMRFLLLSGCRRSEAAGLTRAMIDLPNSVIRLPAVFTKQGRGHDVPITTPLLAILEACPVDARSDLVFASPRSGGPMSGWSQMVRSLCARSQVSFGLHDCRRTFRTGLSRLGVSTEIAELALGHARDELESAYNRDAASESIWTAFELWSRHVEELVR